MLPDLPIPMPMPIVAPLSRDGMTVQPMAKTGIRIPAASLMDAARIASGGPQWSYDGSMLFVPAPYPARLDWYLGHGGEFIP